MNPFALLLPDISLVVFGHLLFRFTGWQRDFWIGLEKLVYYVLFPALLFNTVLHTRIDLGQALPAVSIALGAVGTGVALTYAARRLFAPAPILFASGAQCAFRFNSYVLLALSETVAGSDGIALAAIIIGVCVPLINVAAVLPLARNAGANLLSELARNPLILATLGGLLGNLVGLSLPGPIGTVVARIGGTSLVLGLLAAGAGLRLNWRAAADSDFSRGATSLMVWFTAIKLLAMPLTAYLLARSLNVPQLALLVTVMFASTPTSPAAYILASRMGGDGAFTALLISVSMIASLAALPFWLWVAH
ncbi:MAG: AEC family transporter [Burkholderiales bacterium]|nr:AEC family transporter [Burkholderiales bacterium]